MLFLCLFLFLLFHNLFCKIALLVKHVNHFDRKKKRKKKTDWGDFLKQIGDTQEQTQTDWGERPSGLKCCG